ncbi:MAG: trypsin-like serine protease [Streptosporangiales bacterium]|nr:trypsin-like serine protease [Streptosporangiales bacterium]
MLKRPRSIALTAGALAALVLGTATPASAITYGTPDGNAHPYVGALIADEVFSDGTWAYCSGTLVSPTVFVTAAHCGDPGQTTARVSFSTAYQDGDKVHTGKYVPHPEYGSGGQSDAHDLAVVVFNKPVNGITPARLPGAGLVDRMKANGTLNAATFTSVGYGSLEPLKGPGGHRYRYDDTRNQASGSYRSHTDAWLRLSQNPSTGDGGTCYGDSGGPNFLGGPDSNLLVATTITGDAVCRSTNTDYRLDTPAARAFLDDYVTLP